MDYALGKVLLAIAMHFGGSWKANTSFTVDAPAYVGVAAVAIAIPGAVGRAAS